MSLDGPIADYFGRLRSALEKFDKKSLDKLAELVLAAYANDRTIFLFGNGGSAATASHMCGDFIKGISRGLQRRFRAVCLNDNIPAMTAVANDHSYDDIFVEQLKNFLRPGDLAIGISCSGNSANVVGAIEYAKSAGAVTVAFCGFDGGKIKALADLAIYAPIDDMEISEDIHTIVGHCLKRLIIESLQNR